MLSFPGALQIENSEETDQGKYECVASNVEGVRYSSPANLYVRGRVQQGAGGQKTFYSVDKKMAARGNLSLSALRSQMLTNGDQGGNTSP